MDAIRDGFGDMDRDAAVTLKPKRNSKAFRKVRLTIHE